MIWRTFLEPGQQHLLIKLFTRALQSRGITSAFVDHEDAFVAVVDGERTVFQLDNLAQKCHTVPLDSWRDVIAEHLDRDLGTFTLPDDFTVAQEHLRVKLYDARSVGDLPVVAREVATGLLKVVVYDTPNSSHGFFHDQLVTWGVDADTAFTTAESATRAEYAPTITEVHGTPGTPLMLLATSSGNAYATSGVLWLNDYFTVGPLGAIVAIPCEAVQIVAPLLKKPRVEAVHQLLMDMIKPTHQWFQDGPESVSSELYWWQGGTLTQIEHSSTRFSIPSDLRAALTRAPQAQVES